jgi:two-component system, chemotaxis family, sensor kinase CheA
MDISHLKQKFIDEANELLSGLDNDLLALEKNPESKPHIDQVFRTMHTIKGSSGMYGLDKITEITHELETLYDLVRDQKLSVTKQLIDITFSTADHIRNILMDENLSSQENVTNHALVKEALTQFHQNSGITKPDKNEVVTKPRNTGIVTWQILFYPEESLIFRGVNLSIIIDDLNSLGNCKIHSNYEDDNIIFWSFFLATDKGREAIEDALLFIFDNCKITKIADFDIFDQQELQRKNQENEELEASYTEQTHVPEVSTIDLKINTTQADNSEIKKNAFQNSNRIHVDASKLDTLMYLVTELVTTKSELLLAIQKQSETRILETAEKIEKLSNLFSENALSIRLVPLQEMLLKYQRLIRDLSNQLGKKVNFVLKGEDTELDKNIVDIIGEPIMHLIRNCIDHGIEMPDKRLENGKQETGTVFFRAFESGNNVFIQIGDDGRGIDPDYIYRKAIDQGFIQPGTVLSKKEIFDLIFLPGFSTAQSLSEVSGRGVGMDIVLKKIHEIRGEVSIESTRGDGTTFTIKLQQTISIIDTLLIMADQSVYAIPIEDIESCNLEDHDTIFNRQSKLINYNDELIPLLCLREKFSSQTDYPEKEKLIVINKQGKKYAIVADEIIGQHQAVIKPLGETFKTINFLSGASILGDGSIALLIDTEKLKDLLVAQQQTNM